MRDSIIIRLMQRIAYARLIRVQPQRAVCLVELVELDVTGAGPSQPGYNVNVRQGPPAGAQRDTSLFVGPLTSLAPHARQDARAIAEQRAIAFIRSKLAQGWQVQQTEGFAAFAQPEIESAATPAPAVGQTATASAAVKALCARFAPDAWRLLTPQRQSRSAWRVAERFSEGGGADDAPLRTLVPRLVALLESGNDILDYCLAYALGRLHDAGAREAMRHLSERGRSPATQRIAYQAWLALGGIAPAVPLGEATLEQAYDMAQGSGAIAAEARAKVLSAAASMDLTYGNFKTVRALYKAAEFRNDAPLLAVLHARFENARAERPRRHYGREPKPPFAFSPETRNYLRERAWRRLRRLAAIEHPQCIPLAAGLLLGLNDADLPAAAQEQRYDWGARSYGAQHYTPYSRWLLVRKLLLGSRDDLHGSPRVTRWWTPEPIDVSTMPANRWEAFPALWDAQPAQLLRLLTQSRAAIVHAVAARALRDNTAYLETLSDSVLATLLHTDYAPTAQLAFAIVRRKIESAAPASAKAVWLAMLVRSRDSTAQTFAQNHIAAHFSDYAVYSDILVALLTAATEPLQGLGRGMAPLTAAHPAVAAQAVQQLLEWLEAADDAVPQLPAVLDGLRTVFGDALATAAAGAPPERVASLLLHAHIAIANFGLDWLRRVPQGMAQVTPALMTTLLNAEAPERRAIGVALLGELPDDLLRSQARLLTHYVLSEHASLRAAARVPVQRLAALDGEFAQGLVQQLGTSLFRAEAGEGQHADALQLLMGELEPHTRIWDMQYCWRALTAQSRGAQRMGAWLLTRFETAPWTMRHLTILCKNNELSVRTWAFQRLGALSEAEWASEAGEALALFDSGFDDAREFAQSQFAGRLLPVEFAPSFLVALVDHRKAWVQALGRELIGRKLNADSALDYLLKLSQHPSHDVQLFVTNYLTSIVSDNAHDTAAQLEKLKPYFIAVLSHVHRARIAKDRVLQFLRQQIADPDTARVVADIFSRQVVTASLKDKPEIIAGLRDIAQRHPTLALPNTTIVKLSEPVS